MRFRQIGILFVFAAALVVSGLDEARAAFSEFDCGQPWTEIELGEFIHEFPTTINSTDGDSVDIIVNAVLPEGWFWQVCQVSSGVCYFDDVRVFIESGFDPDILRVDFFPNTSEPGVGYIQLEVRQVDTPGDSRFCTYTLFNGVPEVVPNFQIDCTENTVYSESGATIHEFFAPIMNVSALDDSVNITPVTNLPDGWFSQFCQTSTGVCYFAPATIPLAIGVMDTLRVDFFPGGDGFGQIKLDMFSTSNPSIFRKCAFNVFQGEDGFPASVPELSSPATVASFAQPNPFEGGTAIRFSLTEAVNGDLGIFTADGREVRRMTDLRLPAGDAEVRWDGRDQGGVEAPSGVYFYRLQSGRLDAKGLMVKSR